MISAAASRIRRTRSRLRRCTGALRNPVFALAAVTATSVQMLKPTLVHL
jgi:hypothetical protein